MRTLLNIIWLVFGGLELFLAYILAGLIGFIFIITIPVGIASWRIAGYVLWPFGKAVIKETRSWRRIHPDECCVVPGGGPVAFHRPCGNRGGTGDHDHRDSPCDCEYQDDPDYLLPLRERGGVGAVRRESGEPRRRLHRQLLMFLPEL